MFANHIAKYFSNSIREDGLLAIARYGIIFAPGRAGTTQEIFQDACQNHYASYQEVSPMVFLGTERYTKETPLWETLQRLSEGRHYHEMLLLSDEVKVSGVLYQRSSSRTQRWCYLDKGVPLDFCYSDGVFVSRFLKFNRADRRF
jgi:hypothetical protein